MILNPNSKQKIIKIFLGIFVLVAVTLSAISLNTVDAQNSTSNLGMYYVFVMPDNYYKFRGDKVLFYGSHFRPNETITISKNGQSIGTITADRFGNFTTDQYPVSSTDAVETYAFIGLDSNLPFVTKVTVSGGSPWITLDNYYSPAGSKITIMGHNYSKNENVYVWFDGIYLGTVTTDARGNFNTEMVVPNVGSGQKIVQAIGVKSGLMAKQVFSQAN